MNAADVLRSDRDFKLNIAAARVTPARAAIDGAQPADMHPLVRDLLARRGIRALYSHQTSAYRLTRDGKNVVIVTETASGKSLCYSLPVFNELVERPESRAFFLFPTKALAQDQAASLTRDANALAENGITIGVATYDGDTPQDERAAIRTRAQIVLTNPDMLHAGILPHHTLWADFFSQLRFVVIDEMHAYRGVFGSNVANVIRRLKRVAKSYNSSPQFIVTSATISNPVEHAERMIEEPMVLVDEDGSPKSARQFAIYNPPMANRSLGIRKGALQEAARLTKKLLAANVQAIAFARSRRSVELFLKQMSDSPELREGQVRGYRGGYLPGERREIERGLREGDVRAVVATNALELGIDIGGLDAALLIGYPGTIASTMQQAGRAGRQDRPALAVLVASADPLDQFLARHPEYLFERRPEQALIDPDNLLILLHHIRCAAFELPFTEAECFGRVDAGLVNEFLDVLAESGTLHKSGSKYFWMADKYPAESVSLRSASADNVVLVSNGTTIGVVDQPSANWMVHPGAIYIHEGRSYNVDSLDLERKVAALTASDADYFTEPRSETTLQMASHDRTSDVAGASKNYGEIVVTTQVVGYRKLRWLTRENLGEGEVTLPATELHTTAYWMALRDVTVDALRSEGLWTNDPNDYGPEWERIRRGVRARDNYECQNCHAKEQGREHDVHHKIPFRAFATAELANVMENLVTLCHNCHKAAEAAVRLRSGLASVAYAASHLAPLFLMCDRRDIGMHSDPKSPIADGNPVIAIYDITPGGIGLSAKLYELHEPLMARALELIQECDCESGCPSCVGPGGQDWTGGKREALALLEHLASRVEVTA